jgi:hypothetical protein
MNPTLRDRIAENARPAPWVGRALSDRTSGQSPATGATALRRRVVLTAACFPRVVQRPRTGWEAAHHDGFRRLAVASRSGPTWPAHPEIPTLLRLRPTHSIVLIGFTSSVEGLAVRCAAHRYPGRRRGARGQ